MGEHKLLKPTPLPATPKEHNPEDHALKKFMLGKLTIEMFPEGYVLLNKELATGYHPALERNLNNYPADEIDIRLATIATYCGIVLEGAYTLESRSELCAVLSGRLFHLREFATPQVIIGPTAH